MARFVLAGRADCPHLARAQLLGEQLRASLADFQVHEILVQPDEWEVWLDHTCRAHGWSHSGSPVVWRELVGRGGRALLLGGLADFLEHCQQYYGVVTDMSSEMMLKIAAENREAEEKRKEEAQRQASLLQPFHVWIAGALNPACPILIPHLLSERLFPSSSSASSLVVSLHLLHLEGEEEALRALRTETEELALPLLHQVTAHAGLEEAFRDADVVILLDEQEVAVREEQEREKVEEVREDKDEVKGEVRGEKGDEVKDEVEDEREVREKVEEKEGEVRAEMEKDARDEEGEEKDEEARETQREKELLQRVSMRYRRYGQLIGERANVRGVAVMVAGDAHLNLKCALLTENAPTVDPRRFVAVATPLEYAARARVAQKLGGRAADVTDVRVWGNLSGAIHLDLQRARVFNHAGAIQGPGFFSRPVLEVLHDGNWLKTDLPAMVSGRRATAASEPQGRAASMSIAHGILVVLKAWNGVSHPEGEVLSLGVRCQGHPYVPDGVVCSIPVTVMEGGWSPVLEGVHVGDELRETLQLAVDQLRREKEDACSDL
ncbi:putative malate dehydrogenase 1B [Merluccius polli]|uniref:Malate dehydrogenase 1B n=1 Tax=Merluccius polli TaxID=89951 RepID=A0AA47MVE1_MERPO|nr:putative malate dehydrogenase 1B [Merluccius polli]